MKKPFFITLFALSISNPDLNCMPKLNYKNIILATIGAVAFTRYCFTKSKSITKNDTEKSEYSPENAEPEYKLIKFFKPFESNFKHLLKEVLLEEVQGKLQIPLMPIYKAIKISFNLLLGFKKYQKENALLEEYKEKTAKLEEQLQENKKKQYEDQEQKNQDLFKSVYKKNNPTLNNEEKYENLNKNINKTEENIANKFDQSKTYINNKQKNLYLDIEKVNLNNKYQLKIQDESQTQQSVLTNENINQENSINFKQNESLSFIKQQQQKQQQQQRQALLVSFGNCKKQDENQEQQDNQTGNNLQSQLPIDENNNKKLIDEEKSIEEQLKQHILKNSNFLTDKNEFKWKTFSFGIVRAGFDFFVFNYVNKWLQKKLGLYGSGDIASLVATIGLKTIIPSITDNIQDKLDEIINKKIYNKDHFICSVENLRKVDGEAKIGYNLFKLPTLVFSFFQCYSLIERSYLTI